MYEIKLDLVICIGKYACASKGLCAPMKKKKNAE